MNEPFFPLNPVDSKKCERSRDFGSTRDFSFFSFLFNYTVKCVPDVLAKDEGGVVHTRNWTLSQKFSPSQIIFLLNSR